VVVVQYENDHLVVVVHLVEVTLDDFLVLVSQQDSMFVGLVVDDIEVHNLMDLYEQI
jgi:hypothetical protein